MLELAWDELAEHSAAFRAFACAPCSGFGTNAGKFGMAMDARAYESAALMLVPEGWILDRLNQSAHAENAWCAKLTHTDGGNVSLGSVQCFASTPALALCAAALRAKEPTT